MLQSIMDMCCYSCNGKAECSTATCEISLTCWCYYFYYYYY